MKKLFAALALTLMTTACATTGMYSHVGGALFSNYQDAGMATSDANASKRGVACATNILGIVGSGDASIEAAKKAGGITHVSSVDFDVSNILFVYGKSCTVVKGN